MRTLLALAALLWLFSGANASVFSSRVQINGSTGTEAACKHHLVLDDDTCVRIASANKITFSQIIAWNPELKPACVNIKDFSGKNICVSNPSGNFPILSNTHGATTIITTQAPKPTPLPNMTSTYCGQYYKAAKGDDCTTIGTMFSISPNDLIFLNPELGDNCSRLLPDYYYCVRPVGAISTYTGYGGMHTDEISWFEMKMTPGPRRDIMASYKSNKPKIPIADGTRLDCSLYFWTREDEYDCWSWSILADATLEEFLLWNPSLVQSGIDMGSDLDKCLGTCTISASSSYCLQLNTPLPRNTVDDGPPSRTTIGGATATKRLASTTSGIYSMPSPVQTGITIACTSFYKVAKNDACLDIARGHKISLQDFYAWNPALKMDCSGLQANTYICVAGPHKTTITATGSSTIQHAPTPTQSGMVATCKKYYKVNRDDRCLDIAHKASIRLEDFYKWNPAVKNNCSGLQASVYVCIGI